MNTRLIYTNDEGGLSVIVPASEMFDENSRTRQELAARGMTFANDDEIWNYISAKDVPEGKEFHAIDQSELPAFRDFRNAWKEEGGKVVHDMAKANEIKRDQLREIRKPILEKLDVDYTRADEVKDENTKNVIALKKQALRDVTDFSDFKDITELKDFVPDVFKP